MSPIKMLKLCVVSGDDVIIGSWWCWFEFNRSKSSDIAGSTLESTVGVTSIRSSLSRWTNQRCSNLQVRHSSISLSFQLDLEAWHHLSVIIQTYFSFSFFIEQYSFFVLLLHSFLKFFFSFLLFVILFTELCSEFTKLNALQKLKIDFFHLQSTDCYA